MDPWNLKTLDEAKDLARQFVAESVKHGHPAAFEVVRTKNKPFEVQLFGTHLHIKHHRLLYVAPIPRA